MLQAIPYYQRVKQKRLEDVWKVKKSSSNGNLSVEINATVLQERCLSIKASDLTDEQWELLSILMSEEFVQLSIWDLLEEAKQEPLEVNWNLLWDSLDGELISLEPSEQLQLAADALLQMVEVFRCRSLEAFEELEAYTNDDGPTMSDKDFKSFVRQIVDVDFDEFIEPLINSVRKPYTHTDDNESQSFVEVVDREVLLEAIEEVNQSSPQQQAASVIDIAHSENVSEWINAIANYFVTTPIKLATWSELRKKVNIAPVEIFLGLLMGDFVLSQTQSELHLFYDNEISVELKQ